MKLKQKLNNWQSAGLITPAQVSAIVEFENKPSDNSWWLITTMVCGAMIVGIGIISLVAANWDEISAGTKIFLDFAILILIAIGIYFIAPKIAAENSWKFEVLIMLFIILVLASIGLISQIFHTGGLWFHALFFWSVLTFPIILFSQNNKVLGLWVFAFVVAFTLTIVHLEKTIIATDNFRAFDIFSGNFIFELLLFSPIFISATFELSTRIKGLNGLCPHLGFWQLLTIPIALAIHEQEIYQLYSRIDEKIIFYSTFVFFAFAIILIISNKKYALINKISLILMLVLIMPVFYGDGGEKIVEGSYIIVMLKELFITVFGLSLFAIHNAYMDNRRAFNFLTLLIVLRFIIFYFDAFGGLALTGFGLILSGLIIIAASYFWNIGRKYFLHLLTGSK